MSELYTWSKNGMKMIIDTEFKEFNKQTNYIGNGNVIANTQRSNYVRPWKEIECNGYINEEGHLQNFDLKSFNIPNELRELLKNQTNQVCLYQFHIPKDYYHEDIIGWLVIDNGETIYKKINDRVVLNYIQRDKRQNVLDYCEKIILKKG